MTNSGPRKVRPSIQRLRGSGSQTTLALLAAIALIVLLFGVTQRGFLTAANVFDIAEQTAVVSLVALAMTAVIVGQGIDLSVGSGIALTAVIGAQVLRATGSGPATIAAVIVAGVALGSLNGILVAYLRVSAFMATLGTYAVAAGAAIAISNGASVVVTDPAVLWLGTATYAGVPASLIVTLVAVGLFWVLMKRSLFGRWLYAQGGNRTAGIAAGIPVRRVEFTTYVLTGLMVGVGSLVTIGRVHSMQPLAGQGLEFSAITAAVIGGTSLSGGRGDVISTFLGSVFVGVVGAGLSFMGVDQSLIYVFTGAFVVAAVLVSQREILYGLGDRILVGRLALANRFRQGHVESARLDLAGRQGHSLEIRNLEKRFPGVTALKAVTFDLRSGEVVGLVGENGAGKSTLVKVLAGDHRPNAGEVLIDGIPVQFTGPEDARRAGVAVIHQHFTLVPDLTVAENLFLGEEPHWPGIGVLRRGQMNKATRQLLDELQIPVEPQQRISNLGVGQRQMIEIAKAVRESAWLVVMDEPTSALSARERDHLYAFIDRLRARATAILFISHKLDEIYHVASRAVVLRDGAVVGTPVLAEVPPSQLIGMMVGRSIETVFQYVPAPVADEYLTVVGASDGGVLRKASISVRAGEIVGLVGLMGSGRTELMRCIVGLSPLVSGSVRVLGRAVDHRSGVDLARLGIAYVPEDRLREGLFPELPISENLSLLWIRSNTAFGLIQTGRERELVGNTIHELGIRPPDPRRQVRNLSGGNQQKVVLGKSFVLAPRLVLLDDPTRGVDVGAKAEIHALVARLKVAGAAILMTSSEMPEVLAVADRVVVMRHGETVAEYQRGASEDQVMFEAFGESATSGAAEPMTTPRISAAAGEEVSS